MQYKWQFRPYRRSFLRPLQTHHGCWTVREGIVLKLTDEAGQTGWGEIAPIAGFGSETLEQALAFCQQLPTKITIADIATIPETLPACQFGFESALTPPTAPFELQPSRLCALLPTENAIATWKPFWEQGYRTFKWKIGVEPIAAELDWLRSLVEALPLTARLRLDANGGLSHAEADRWLTLCDDLEQVEYLEQPFPVEQFAAMQTLTQQYRTTIALDESVATLAHLQTCADHGWRGVVVIKPAIAGSPTRLWQVCHSAIDAVFSSALETAIGRSAGLRLASELSNPARAIGYGTSQWFADAEPDDFEQLWQRL